MYEQIREQWCAALRSGEYGQGRGHLRQGDEEGGYNYCCLGVLTDLAVKAGVTSWDAEAMRTSAGPCPPGWYEENTGAGRLGYYLSPATREWAGLAHDDPRIGREHERAAALNDRGHPFTEIADKIGEYINGDGEGEDA